MDIDIDVKPSFKPAYTFPKCTHASMIQNNELKQHPCGIYFQNIPTDPFDHISAIPYKQAEQLGYFKIDFLHLTLLNQFNNKQEIRELLKIEPDWELLKSKEVVEKLFHLKNWFDVLNIIEPKSIQDLADCLAIIRPNKQSLLVEYVKNKQTTRKKLYTVDKGDKTSFKKAHAIAYATLITLQLHLIKQGKL